MAGSEMLQQAISNYYEEAIHICNHTVLSIPAPTDGMYCPATFDHWALCFNYTKAGTNVYLPCPSLIFSKTKGMAFRRCDDTGQWQTNSNGIPFTNMSDCIKNETVSAEHYHQSVSYVHLFVALSALSIILVTISLAIFYGFRQLRCDRITIHKNLFISYLLNAITWILFYRLIVLDGMVIIKNPVWCQLLHVLSQTFTATSYSWMFCEGLYLHMIMAHALRTGKKLLKCLMIGGWVVPIITTAIYATVRWATAQKISGCWIQDDLLLWIIAAPIAVSCLINICILVNLVRLLMTKLKQIPDAPQSKKAAKATLILVPLLGLQFLVFPMRPDHDSDFYVIYLHIMAFLQSSQGIMVSIIFCFCNGEVRSLIRWKWQQHKMMYEGGRKNMDVTTSTVVDGYSMVDSTRDGTSVRSKGTQDNHHKHNESLEIKGSPAVTTPLVTKDNSTDVKANHLDD